MATAPPHVGVVRPGQPGDGVQQNHHVSSDFGQALGALESHLPHPDVVSGSLVQSGHQDLPVFSRHAAPPAGGLLGPLVHQQHDHVDLGVAGGDGIADLLHQHRLAGTGRGHDQTPLSPADGTQQIHDPQAHITVIRLEHEHRLRIDDGEFLEGGARLGLVRVEAVHRLHGRQGQALGTAVGHARLADDLAAFLQLVGAAHSRRHEHVPFRLRGLEVVVLRLTQPAGAVLAKLDHPSNRLGGALDLRDEVRTRLAPPAAALAPAPSLLARSSASLGRTHPFG